MEEKKIGFCKIHGNLDESNAYVCITKSLKRGWRLRCKDCSCRDRKNEYERRKEQYIKYTKDWCKENKEITNERQKNYRKENPERYRETDKRKRLKQIERLGSPLFNKIKKVGKYRMTVEDYDSLMRDQNGVCAICKKVSRRRNTSRVNELAPLSVDHCHSSGKIRGLLCGSCNSGLGMFQDNIEYMKEAIQYLQKHQ